MTNCAAWQDLLAQYVADGEPLWPEYEALRCHLAVCPECQATAEALRRVDLALREWPRQPVPKGLAPRILATIEQETYIEPWKPLPWSVWLPVLTLLAAVGLAITLAPVRVSVSAAFPWGVEPLQCQLLEDPALLWAIWLGVAVMVFGAGITIALVQGRLPNQAEMDHLRDKLSHTAQRLLHLAGR